MKAVLDHIGIAVRDLDAALAFYRDALGLEIEAPEDVISQRVRARFVAVGNATLELLEATAPDSPIAKYLETRGRDAVLFTDSRNHWAHPWVVAVVRAGIMDAYDNHTFQPRNAVRRADLAQAVRRLLMVIGGRDAQARAWAAARSTFTDLGPGHLAYQAASAAVASGVMSVAPGNAFQPSHVATGAEAVEAVSRIEHLATRAGFEFPR